jgi:hypothetical protein
LDYNPFAAPYAELNQKIAILDKSKNETSEQIEWFKSFDGSNLNATRLELKSFETALKKVKTKQTKVNKIVKELTEATAFDFWSPSEWFSDERSQKKLELASHQQTLSEVIQEQIWLQEQIQLKQSLLATQEAELERYRSFNLLEAEAIVKGLNIQIEQLVKDVAQVKPHKDRVDSLISVPLAELRKFEKQQEYLEQEIGEAEVLARQISSTQNKKTRWEAHCSCEEKFGVSNPTQVIRAKNADLESIKRSIKKLKERVQSLSNIASRDVKKLVIDGNNLCYQGESFIGLGALQVVAEKLSSNYETIIVFDASISRLLNIPHQSISNCFGHSVKCHVVAKGRMADETLLDVAADRDTYVISNDRFIDFPDKVVVSDKRLIRHEILDGMVLIPDLQFSERFLSATNLQATDVE